MVYKERFCPNIYYADFEGMCACAQVFKNLATHVARVAHDLVVGVSISDLQQFSNFRGFIFLSYEFSQSYTDLYTIHRAYQFHLHYSHFQLLFDVGHINFFFILLCEV